MTVIFLTTALGAGCTGKIGNVGGVGSGPGSGAGGNPASPSGGGGGPSADLAAQYFAGTAAADAPKRLVRLSRTQLDLTAKALLPKLTVPSALTAMPSDPLQTSYEYADFLTFNPANFTPFANWVAAIAASAKAAPDKVIDCAAGGNTQTCLADKAKSFARTAFRGTLTDAQLTRFADFFTASASAVGLPSATADLVDVTLTSPRFAFRDEVLTDASGTLQPAQHLQHITYTLADAPPRRSGSPRRPPPTTSPAPTPPRRRSTRCSPRPPRATS